MSKESKEIREIMNDINQIIIEGYVFDHNSSKKIPESDDNDDSIEFGSTEAGNPGLGNVGIKHRDSELDESYVNIDNEVKEMRKIALNVIIKLTPDVNQEAYKLVKGVWDSCDKFLSKDTKDIKPQQDNN
jgi:hypothetical protein